MEAQATHLDQPVDDGASPARLISSSSIRAWSKRQRRLDQRQQSRIRDRGRPVSEAGAM
jgi:hypothetical protein